MKEVLDTVFYCILIVSVVGILFYLIIKESRDYRPYEQEETPQLKPTTWDDYEKQLDKITSVEREDLNIVSLNDEPLSVFDEKDIREEEIKERYDINDDGDDGGEKE